MKKIIIFLFLFVLGLSFILATLGASFLATENVQIEKKMVLNQFEYKDKNNDGIYMTEIQAPLVHGEYEIISIIEYKDTAYGKKELRLTAVVDPEGYIYEKNGNKETRIPDAKISLFVKNKEISRYKLLKNGLASEEVFWQNNETKTYHLNGDFIGKGFKLDGLELRVNGFKSAFGQEDSILNLPASNSQNKNYKTIYTRDTKEGKILFSSDL